MAIANPRNEVTQNDLSAGYRVVSIISVYSQDQGKVIAEYDI